MGKYKVLSGKSSGLFPFQVVERENLLGKLSEYIGRERKGFRDVGPARRIHGVPDTVNNIYFVRQLQVCDLENK